MNHLCHTHNGCYHHPLNSLEERQKCGLYQVLILFMANILLVAICIGSKASEKLDDVVTNTRLLLDMKKLSPLYQTSSLSQCSQPLCT